MNALTAFQYVCERAAEAPDAPALSGAGRTWTYSDLCHDAERLAAAFLEVGLKKGDRLGVVSSNHPAMCLAWLAGARCGVITCLFNSNFLATELSWLLSHTDPVGVLADVGHEAVVDEAVAMADRSPIRIIHGDGDTDRGAIRLEDMLDAAPLQGQHPSADDLLFVAYTSGTTAHPKGAAFTHRAELYTVISIRDHFGLGPSDATLAVTPLFHVSGMRNSVAQMWVAGGHVAVEPRFSASNYWRRVVEVGATYTTSVETMWLMLEQQPVTEDEEHNPIRLVMGGGSPEMVERVEKRFGLRMVQCYGQTEVGLGTVVPIDLPAEQLHRYRWFAKGAKLAGLPMATNQVRIVDPHGFDVAVGETGEMLIKSPGLMSEYVGNPQATKAALRGGWMHTGDLALQGPDGYVYFVDRVKDMIRRGGENISPKEVEAALSAHPQVLDAAVFSVPDPVWIEEVKAIVVPTNGGISAAALWDWCAGRLAPFKIPRYIEFRSDLPRSTTGRVQKQVLRSEPIFGDNAVFDRQDERSTREAEPSSSDGRSASATLEIHGDGC